MAETFLDIIDELLGSFDGTRYHQGDGTIAFGWIQAPEDQAADHTIVETDFREDYQVIESRASPARSVEVEYLHIGHTEQAGDLLADALPRDVNLWKDPSRTVEKHVPGGTILYKLSSDEPVRIPARWSTRAGAAVEAERLRDRIADRESGEIQLDGARWLYSTVAPNDYLSVSHPRVPGGTASLVVFEVVWDLGADALDVLAWGALAE